MTYSQNDPAWRGDRLGSGPLAIGSNGCYLTSDAQLLTWAGHPIDPGALNRLYVDLGIYVSGDLLRDSALADAFPALWRSEEVYRCEATPCDQSKLDNDDPDVYVVVEMANASGGTHFAPVTDWRAWRIADPWDGQERTIGERGRLWGWGTDPSALVVKVVRLRYVGGAMTLLGWDGSKWQAGAYAGGGGFSFALWKASEGNGYADPTYAAAIAAIRAHGLIPGAYHFARPDLGNGPEAEADWFLRVVGDPRGMLLALDLEVGSGNLASWRDRFCDRVQARAGKPCWWYCYQSFISTRALNTGGTDYPFWLAWPDANGPLPSYAFGAPRMQQWGLTSVPGISGSVDANRFPGSLDDLRALTIGGSRDMPLDPANPNDALVLRAAMMIAATDAGRDPNGTPADIHWLVGYMWTEVQKQTGLLAELLGDEKQVQASLDALTKQLQAATTSLADLKTALGSVVAGDVDEAKLATDLAPHLGDAVAQALARKLAT